jgi:hypothetical protein
MTPEIRRLIARWREEAADDQRVSFHADELEALLPTDLPPTEAHHERLGTVGNGLDRGRTVAVGETREHAQGGIHVYNRDPPTFLCEDCRQQWLASHASYLLATSEPDGMTTHQCPPTGECWCEYPASADLPPTEAQEGNLLDLKIVDDRTTLTECCGALVADTDRFCPTCGWEFRALLVPGAIGDLLAYGHEEATNALKRQDRDQYQFWQGWNAALQRVPPPADLPPTEAPKCTCWLGRGENAGWAADRHACPRHQDWGVESPAVPPPVEPPPQEPHYLVEEIRRVIAERDWWIKKYHELEAIPPAPQDVDA